jgi:hypothetical protein
MRRGWPGVRFSPNHRFGPRCCRKHIRQSGTPSMEKRVHELGVWAGVITDAEKRAHVYGEFLATCADCHTMVHAFD